MNDREMSDLSMSRAECPKCGAVWINGQHYWSGTGKKGNELDLAGLVCNRLKKKKKGDDGGDTWEKRMADLETGFGSLHERMTDMFKKESED